MSDRKEQAALRQTVWCYVCRVAINRSNASKAEHAALPQHISKVMRYHVMKLVDQVGGWTCPGPLVQAHRPTLVD